jgi:SAM-dependent methyltransferase
MTASSQHGPEQTWQAESYARNARFVSELGMPVVALLAPKSGERILDLGCGDGALTEKIAAVGCTVVGVDTSRELLAVARSRGLDVHEADGQALAFGPEFDAVFSNAAIHWMRRADDVIAGVRRALKPGGRFVGEFGGFGNVAAIRVAVHAVLHQAGYDPSTVDPWFFPTPADYQGRLEAQGFRLDRIELIPRPTQLPTAIGPWLDTFASSFFSIAPESEHVKLCGRAAALLRPALCDEQGNWTADYVRLRFAAHI